MAKLLKASTHDIGGLAVKRILPNFYKKMVGPFIFFDHMGPNHFEAGQGINVLPHPHIGLSTLTYLFEGALMHRDSLGNHLEITPGDVNWMTAGKGIVHSERESFETRANAHALNGLQCWVALPEHYADLEPDFTHIGKEQLPILTQGSVMIRLIAGEAYGMSSPVKTYSPMFYLDIAANQGDEVETPDPGQETAFYPIAGRVSVNGETYEAGEFILLEPGETQVKFETCGRLIMLGGDKFEQTPRIHWNFVSFSKERIEQAKDDWKYQRFAKIPGDDKEYIPL